MSGSAFLVSTDTERWPEHRGRVSISKPFGVSGGKREAQRESKSSRQLIFITHFCSTGAGQASKRSPLGFIALYMVAEMSGSLVFSRRCMFRLLAVFEMTSSGLVVLL